MSVIGTDGKSSVRPEQVNTARHFYDAFDNNETEVSAHYIVLLCQEKGGWFPFTKEEIESVYTRRGHTDGFWFNRLITGFWIVEKDDKYHITKSFVDRVYKSSPAGRWTTIKNLVKGYVGRLRK